MIDQGEYSVRFKDSNPVRDNWGWEGFDQKKKKTFTANNNCNICLCNRLFPEAYLQKRVFMNYQTYAIYQYNNEVQSNCSKDIIRKIIPSPSTDKDIFFTVYITHKF